MGANWSPAKKPSYHEKAWLGSEARYRNDENETHHDTSGMPEILGRHHNATDSWNVPLDMRVSSLRRPDDGLPMADGWLGDGPSFAELVDIDRDGVEFVEVVNALLMLPPGPESMLTDAPTGELLYPEVDPVDAEQSVLEVSLRNELNDLVQRVAKLHRRVLDHREDLECSGGDTRQFIQQEAASLAMQVAKISDDVNADNKKEGLRLIHRRLVDFANSGASEPQRGQIVPAGSHSRRTPDRHGGSSGSRGSNGVVCEAEILPSSSSGKSTVCCSLPLPYSEKLAVSCSTGSTSCWVNDGENIATDQVIRKHRSNLAHEWHVDAYRAKHRQEVTGFGGLAGSVKTEMDLEFESYVDAFVAEHSAGKGA